jgi:dihydroxyacetone kinase-like protein
MGVTTEKAVAIITAIAKVIQENKQYLSDLDQAIGDGDHGFNMARGFEAVIGKLGAQPSADLGEVFKTTAMALISNVGGASGPLYGTLFLKMSASLKGKTEIGLEGFVVALKEGIQGVQARGKAVQGEKTMLDVLFPILEHLERAVTTGMNDKEAWIAAAALAEKCRNETKDIIATKGRAAYLGERSKGHIDPGATSSCMMVQTIAKEL